MVDLCVSTGGFSFWKNNNNKKKPKKPLSAGPLNVTPVSHVAAVEDSSRDENIVLITKKPGQ